MKTPKFWYQEKKIIHIFLIPLSYIYRILAFLRKYFTKVNRITNKKLICIGNFTVGGAGKTPVSIAFGNFLEELNIKYVYLGHGYKAKIKNFTLINNKTHLAKDVGDEALLLSKIAPTFIAGSRVFAAQKISKMPDYKAIILDDGLQNTSLKKDFSVAVIDGNCGFGNGLIFPAGPLREGYKRVIKNIDLIIIVGDDEFNVTRIFKEKKVILAKIKTSNKPKLNNKDVIAFCGIGRPDKFYKTLEQNFYKIVKKIDFPDHYDYKNSDLDKLLKLSISKKATLITTAKDFVKINKEYQEKIKVLDIEIDFTKTDKKYIKDKLKEIISVE